MKKSIIILLTILVFTLSACANNNIESKTELNRIVQVELTNREYAVLSTTSNQKFVFDFHVESDYKEAAVWIEKYEFGKLVDDRVGYLSKEVGNSGSIYFTMDDLNASENEIFFNLGINSNGVTNYSAMADIISTKGRDSRTGMRGSVIDGIVITDEDMVLINVAYTWDKSSRTSFSDESDKDADHHNNKLENYEVAYLLKSAFTK